MSASPGIDIDRLIREEFAAPIPAIDLDRLIAEEFQEAPPVPAPEFSPYTDATGYHGEGAPEPEPMMLPPRPINPGRERIEARKQEIMDARRMGPVPDMPAPEQQVWTEPPEPDRGFVAGVRRGYIESMPEGLLTDAQAEERARIDAGYGERPPEGFAAGAGSMVGSLPSMLTPKTDPLHNAAVLTMAAPAGAVLKQVAPKVTGYFEGVGGRIGAGLAHGLEGGAMNATDAAARHAATENWAMDPIGASLRTLQAAGIGFGGGTLLGGGIGAATGKGFGRAVPEPVRPQPVPEQAAPIPPEPSRMPQDGPVPPPTPAQARPIETPPESIQPPPRAPEPAPEPVPPHVPRGTEPELAPIEPVETPEVRRGEPQSPDVVTDRSGTDQAGSNTIKQDATGSSTKEPSHAQVQEVRPEPTPLRREGEVKEAVPQPQTQGGVQEGAGKRVLKPKPGDLVYRLKEQPQYSSGQSKSLPPVIEVGRVDDNGRVRDVVGDGSWGFPLEQNGKRLWWAPNDPASPLPTGMSLVQLKKQSDSLRNQGYADTAGHLDAIREHIGLRRPAAEWINDPSSVPGTPQKGKRDGGDVAPVEAGDSGRVLPDPLKMKMADLRAELEAGGVEIVGKQSKRELAEGVRQLRGQSGAPTPKAVDSPQVIAPTEAGRTSPPPETTKATGGTKPPTARGRPTDRIEFAKPIAGPSGATLHSYEWTWKPEATINHEGDEVARRVSDWERAINSAETGRNVVHQFVVKTPDGDSRAVSLESALRLLGYTDEAQAKGVRSAASTVKTIAASRMELDILRKRQAEIAKVSAEVRGLQKPSITRHVTDTGSVWWQMGDARVRDGSKAETIPAERRQALESSWEQSQAAARGVKPYEESSVAGKIRAAEAKLGRAEKALRDINPDQPAPAKSGGDAPVPQTGEGPAKPASNPPEPASNPKQPESQTRKNPKEPESAPEVRPVSGSERDPGSASKPQVSRTPASKPQADAKPDPIAGSVARLLTETKNPLTLQLIGRDTGATPKQIVPVLAKMLDEGKVTPERLDATARKLIDNHYRTRPGLNIIIPKAVEEAAGLGSRALHSARSMGEGGLSIGRWLTDRATGYMERLGKAGKQLADDTKDVDRRAHKQAATDAIELRHLFKGLDRKQRETLAKAMNKRIPVPAGAEETIGTMRKVLDRAMNEANVVGLKRTVAGAKVDIKGSGKAFPQVPNATGRQMLDELGTKGLASPRVMRAIENVVNAERKRRGGRTGHPPSEKEQLRALAQLKRLADQQRRGINPYFERTRIELPEDMIEWDPARVLPGLIQKNWMLVEGARKWGADFSGQEALTQTIAYDIDAYHAKVVGDYLKTQYGVSGLVDTKLDKAVRGVSNYETFSKMGFSVLSALRNMGGRFSNLFAYDPAVQLRAHADYPPFINQLFKASRELGEKMERTGAVRANSALADIETGAPGYGLTSASMAMFKPVERGNQILTAHVAGLQLAADIDRLARAKPQSGLAKMLDSLVSTTGLRDTAGGVRRRVERAGLTPERITEILADPEHRITPAELEAAAYHAVNDTQFAMSLATNPVWWNSRPVVRLMWKFKTWPVRQIGLVYNNVAKEAVKGNFAPLVRFMVAMTITGELYHEIRDVVSGRDDSILSAALSGETDMGEYAQRVKNSFVAGGGLGLLADLTYGISDMAGGPAMATARNLMEAAAAFAQRPTVLQGQAAARKFIREEFSIAKQIGKQADRIDRAFFNENNVAGEYGKIRAKGFAYRDEIKGGTGKTISEALTGRTFNFGPNSLPYEYAARQVTVGDEDDAAVYLASVLKDAADLRAAVAGVRQSMASKAPLGAVAEKDRAKFLATLTPEERAAALKLDREWRARYSRALSAAIRKARESAAAERNP